MRAQLSLLLFLGLIVAVMLGGVAYFGTEAQNPNDYLGEVYLSEVEEGQSAVTINEDGTSSVVCFSEIGTTAGVPDKFYNIAVREITRDKIVVDVNSKNNYDGIGDIVVGFKTTKEISPSCVIQVSCYDWETDSYSSWEIKR